MISDLRFTSPETNWCPVQSLQLNSPASSADLKAAVSQNEICESGEFLSTRVAQLVCRVQLGDTADLEICDTGNSLADAGALGRASSIEKSDTGN
jgi:hypothetical protein